MHIDLLQRPLQVGALHQYLKSKQFLQLNLCSSHAHIWISWEFWGWSQMLKQKPVHAATFTLFWCLKHLLWHWIHQLWCEVKPATLSVQRRVGWAFDPCVEVNVSSTPSGLSLCSRCWTCCRDSSEVKHWCWPTSSDSQSDLHFIPKVLKWSGVEVAAQTATQQTCSQTSSKHWACWDVERTLVTDKWKFLLSSLPVSCAHQHRVYLSVQVFMFTSLLSRALPVLLSCFTPWLPVFVWVSPPLIALTCVRPPHL